MRGTRSLLIACAFLVSLARLAATGTGAPSKTAVLRTFLDEGVIRDGSLDVGALIAYAEKRHLEMGDTSRLARIRNVKADDPTDQTRWV